MNHGEEDVDWTRRGLRNLVSDRPPWPRGFVPLSVREGRRRDRWYWRFLSCREAVALWLAPWLTHGAALDDARAALEHLDSAEYALPAGARQVARAALARIGKST